MDPIASEMLKAFYENQELRPLPGAFYATPWRYII
jgi:hypothetical protein